MADEPQYRPDEQGFYQPNFYENQEAGPGMYEDQGYDMSGAGAAGGQEQFPQDTWVSLLTTLSHTVAFLLA